MGWKKSKYEGSILRKAQDAVNRRNAAAEASDETSVTRSKPSDARPKQPCICGVIVPGDDGNQECPVHFRDKRNSTPTERLG